jgi:hypothetical protein
MKILILILLATLGFGIKANSKMVLMSDSTKINSVKLAKDDIKKGYVNFLIHGGIAPKYFKNQNVFEEKYKVKYRDFGCVMPANVSITDYNNVVAQYLDKKFGLKWRSEVRKDIVGI